MSVAERSESSREVLALADVLDVLTNGQSVHSSASIVPGKNEVAKGTGAVSVPPDIRFEAMLVFDGAALRVSPQPQDP
jgi:hypothetical protein